MDGPSTLQVFHLPCYNGTQRAVVSQVEGDHKGQMPSADPIENDTVMTESNSE